MAKKKVTYEDVIESRHVNYKTMRDYLEESGWKYTCAFPDCVWRWTKSIRGVLTAMDIDHACYVQRTMDSLDRVQASRETSPEGEQPMDMTGGV